MWVDAVAEDGDGFGVVFDGGLVGADVGAVGEAGGDGDAGLGELTDDVLGGALSVGGQAAGSDDGDAGPPAVVEVSTDEQEDGGLGDVFEEGGVDGVVVGEYFGGNFVESLDGLVVYLVGGLVFFAAEELFDASFVESGGDEVVYVGVPGGFPVGFEKMFEGLVAGEGEVEALVYGKKVGGDHFLWGVTGFKLRILGMFTSLWGKFWGWMFVEMGWFFADSL